MLVENIAYLLTFIISTGIAVIGILGSYNLFQAHKEQVLQLLLYQQIFLFSFFIYGIWGNIAIQEIVSDLNLSDELPGKLALFVPVIGTPFLIISWFMLIKLAYHLNGYKIPRLVVFIYFFSLFALIFTYAFLEQNRLIPSPRQPELFIVRALVLLNFAIHLALVFPVFKPKKNSIAAENGRGFQQIFIFYFAGVVLYSVLLFYLHAFGFISTCISIVVLFGASIIIPATIQFSQKQLFRAEEPANMDFKAFCERYEISNREAEIILEICSGKTNKAIAEKLFITLQTVKDHNHRIFTKTQVKSRVQLTNLVREETGELPSAQTNIK